MAFKVCGHCGQSFFTTSDRSHCGSPCKGPEAKPDKPSRWNALEPHVKPIVILTAAMTPEEIERLEASAWMFGLTVPQLIRSRLREVGDI